jgi:D-glycerate 3-kinase
MDDDVTFDAAWRAALDQFTVEEELPDPFRAVFLEWYAGITAHLAEWAFSAETVPLIGFSGCQGSGKSTLVKAMAHVLRRAHGVAVAVLSLDDFYLPKSARQAMADAVHPLFATRGVPGTHDLVLLTRTIAALRGTGSVPLPRFDKATDDRTEMVHWRQESAPVGLILLEGWCIGMPPQQDDALLRPVNETEANKDADRVWRAEVNRQLGGDYATLFAELDALLLLQAPSFDAVFNWRWQQEQQLSRRFQRDHPASKDPTMTQSEVADFVLHYQRLTEHGMATLPDRADCIWELTEDRSVAKMRLVGLAA